MAAICYPPAPSSFQSSCAYACRFTFGVTSISTFRSSEFSHRTSNSLVCRCSHSAWRWDSVLREAVKIALSPLESYITEKTRNICNEASHNDNKAEEDWDWGQWKSHFDQIDEQERIVSVLKSQLDLAILREDYQNAAKIKVAIAAVAANDAVGKVMTRLHRAIKEERYQDAVVMRDYAGAGLVGWWAGISSNTDYPSGQIIHISAEYGRYVARSYTPGQLATSNVGVPFFEIFLTKDKKHGYRQQAVYLKPVAVSQKSPAFIKSAENTSNHESSLSMETATSDAVTEDTNGSQDDHSDGVPGVVGSQDMMKNMVPGLKIHVLGVTSPGKIDRDFTFKILDFTREKDTDAGEDEKRDSGEDSDEEDDKNGSGEDGAELNGRRNEIEQGRNVDESSSYSDDILDENKTELGVKVIIGEIVKILLNYMSNGVQRVPAKLIKFGRSSFSFSTNDDELKGDCIGKKGTLAEKKMNLKSRVISRVVFNLSKSTQIRTMPSQVLNDLDKLISLTLNKVGNPQPFSGAATFNRIETPVSPDPLNGLYVGLSGNFSTGVIHLRRKFGKWQDDGDVASAIEFYEYVEAFKLTGDQYIPAGQVAFRAKIGKRDQIPLRGLIPEELGVIARYKGQGRLAEQGFQNPRWISGELVILDGKRLKGGPAIGFLYWDLDHQYFVLFNRLTLHH